MAAFEGFRSTPLLLQEHVETRDRTGFWARLWGSLRQVSEWRLAKPLKVEFSEIQTGDTYEITVPEGFITDLASVPRPLRWVASVTGIWNRPAVLHDYLYEHSLCFEQADADAIFRDWMAELGVSWPLRNLMWAGVRTFGWTKWG